jgi:succinate dehydrogenase/fumarate reductase flavoprotein subunit
VQRFNRFVDQGEDTDCGRFGPGVTGAAPPPIRMPPYYAIQLFPMTRQSMGGIRVDHDTRVLAREDGRPLPGLFAAGEVTGVAGINGSFGGSGGFLGPSLLMGRVAGRNAAALALDGGAARNDAPAAPVPTRMAAGNGDPPSASIGSTGQLTAWLEQQRPGFWHFRVSHALVLERDGRCATCHRDSWSPGPANGQAQRLIQLESCTRCH